VVTYLAEIKANIEAKNNRGNTPMHYAAKFSKTEVVTYLAESKANIEAKNNKGETPLDLAKVKGKTEVIKVLQKLKDQKRAQEEARKKQEIEAKKREAALRKRENKAEFFQNRKIQTVIAALFNTFKGSNPSGISLNDDGDSFETILKILYPDCEANDRLLAKLELSASKNDVDESETLQHDEFCSFLWTNLPNEIQCEKKESFGIECLIYLKNAKKRARKAGFVMRSTKSMESGSRQNTNTSTDFNDAKSPKSLKHGDEPFLKLLEAHSYNLIKAADAKLGRAVIANTTNGSWEEECELGKGSFGKVYAARNEEDEQMYAVKVFDLGKKSRKEIKKIKQECRLLAKLHHSYIIRYGGIMKSRNIYCITMELCSKDLAGVIKSGIPIETKKIKEYTLQIASGLDYLHSCNPSIVHRDLKADNILISFGGEAKIADIGLAVEGGGIGNLKTDALLSMAATRGHICYRAPENMSHYGSFDMWSLGLIITEMATNKFIYEHRFMRSGRCEVFKIPGLIKNLKGQVAARNDRILDQLVNGLVKEDELKRLTAKKVIQLVDPKKTIETVIINQKIMIKNQEIGFGKLEQRMQGLFKTFLNVNLDRDSANIPKYIVMLPGVRTTTRSNAFFKNLVSKFKDWSGVEETFHLWICDEGPLLSKPLPVINRPLHDPIQITIPGKTLRVLAPLLRLLNAILLTAKVVGTVTTGIGAVIPNGIPGLEQLEEKSEELSEFVEKMIEMTDEEIGEIDEDAAIDAKENTSTVVGKGKSVHQECYNCLKALLSQPDEKTKSPPETKNGETLDDLLRTKVVRMVNKNSGMVRWFAKSRIENPRELKHLKSLGFEGDDRAFGSPPITSSTQAGPPAVAPKPTASQCCTVL